MGLCKRLIARLDIKGSRLIKGIRFEGLRVLGDPCEAAFRYAEEGADELLYIDAVASLYGRNGLSDLLRRTSREVFVPVTAGGGVRSVDDAAALLAAGADKVAINTAALKRPELISELAQAFGSQCVVVSIQARRVGIGAWEAMAEAGRERTGKDVLHWMDSLQKLGAGEILLTSVDQDGTCSGPDIELIEKSVSISCLPLITGGGFSSLAQVRSTLEIPGISSVSIGAALHRKKLNLSTLKSELSSNHFLGELRPATKSLESIAPSSSMSLTGNKIGVIDYGMGNQQSLVNAFEKLGADILLSNNKSELELCDLLALPGVGSFPNGMFKLNSTGLSSFLREWSSSSRPLLGICLGMQMLFDSGEEFSKTDGLGLLPGKVVSMRDIVSHNESLIFPHMGWNLLERSTFFPDFLPTTPFHQYFVHSFVASEVDPKSILYYCTYGDLRFVAAVCASGTLR